MYSFPHKLPTNRFREDGITIHVLDHGPFLTREHRIARLQLADEHTDWNITTGPISPFWMSVGLLYGLLTAVCRGIDDLTNAILPVTSVHVSLLVEDP